MTEVKGTAILWDFAIQTDWERKRIENWKKCGSLKLPLC